MRARMRHWRARARRRQGVPAVPWFVIVLFLVISLQRLLLAHVTPTLHSCEATLFWLSGWEEHRSVLQVTGAMIAASWLWWLAAFRRRGWRVHLFAGLVLIAWTASFNHQVRTLLPDRAHPVAGWIDRLPLVADAPLYLGEARPRWPEGTAFVRADVPGLAERLALDTAPDWYLGRAWDREVYAGDRPLVTTYPRLERWDGLRGEDAPTHGQLEAARACVAYNGWTERQVAAALAAGGEEWVPGRFRGPHGSWAEDVAWTRRVVLPPVSMRESARSDAVVDGAAED